MTRFLASTFRVLLATACILAGSALPASEIQPAPNKVSLFSLRQVRLLEGEFKQHQELNKSYLLSLDPDRLLSCFRKEAGLAPKAPPYGGWESDPTMILLPGAILGFYLEALSTHYQATGDPALLQRITYTVAQLAEAQDAARDGFLLASPNARSVLAEVAKGKIEIGGLPWTGSVLNGVSEPTYTLNKVLLGLKAAADLAGNVQARQIHQRLAEWFGKNVLDALDEAQTQQLLECEHGSLHEDFADAYAWSGDARFLRWAQRLCHQSMIGPFANGQDILTQFHANTQIPKFTGFLKIAPLVHDERLARAARFFWDSVTSQRSWIIGGNSVREHFNHPNEFDEAAIDPVGPETCNSVNMLRLTQALYLQDGDPKRIDYCERILYNHILASHDPKRGMFVYYTSMRPGHYRVYSTEHDAMWCCVGTGMTSPGRYAELIYAHNQDALFVNLFIPSELSWPEKGIRIRQTTRIPDEDSSVLDFSCDKPTRLDLKLRIPAWLGSDTPRVRINGIECPIAAQSGSYALISRVWSQGDKVELILPMRVRTEPLPNSKRYLGFLYGPVVLAGELGGTGFDDRSFWNAKLTVAIDVRPLWESPVLVGERASLASQFKRLSTAPLAFSAPDLIQPGTVRLIPFHRIHFQRYAVYWPLLSSTEWPVEKARRESLCQRLGGSDTIDTIRPSVPSSEQDHQMRTEKSRAGWGPDRVRWRNADAGGQFGYNIKPSPDRGTKLVCLWVAEAGQTGTDFDIQMGGQRVSAKTVCPLPEDSSFVLTEHEIPEALGKGKTSLPLTFLSGNAKPGPKLIDLRVFAESAHR